MVLRDRPAVAATRRWLAGASAQADAAGVELVVDGSSVDQPSLRSAVRRAVDAQATDAVLVDTLGLGGLPEVEVELARAAVRGLPVAVQTPQEPPHVPVVVRSDDAQLVSVALNSAPTVPAGSDVGLVTTIPGYGDLDRRVAAWTTFRDARGWREVLLDDEAAQYVSTDPDGGATASIVRAALLQQPRVQLLAAPSAFLGAAAASAAVAAGLAETTHVIAVLDAEDDDVDLSPLAMLTGAAGPAATAALVDPAELGAACVRAVALLLAGQLPPGAHVAVPGQVVTSADLVRLGATTTGELLPHLTELRGRTGTDVATADWLPPVTVPW